MSSETKIPKERGMIFTGESVRGILAGRKTQTRRIVKPQPVIDNGLMRWKDIELSVSAFEHYAGPRMAAKHSPYGQPGNRLYVKESFERIHRGTDVGGTVPTVVYLADKAERERPEDDKPSPKRYSALFMPRSLSRITLELCSVRVERLQAITEEDAKAEGCIEPQTTVFLDTLQELHGYRGAYALLWENINGKKPGCDWASDPFVWVLEFRRVERD